MSVPTDKPAPRGRRRPGAEAAAGLDRTVLDSSCWMEFFADTDRADLFAARIEQVEQLIVPVTKPHRPRCR